MKEPEPPELRGMALSHGLGPTASMRAFALCDATFRADHADVDVGASSDLGEEEQK